MSKLFKNNIMHNTVRTEVIYNNGKNTDNGYVIKHPYATTQKFNTEDGQIEIPVYCLIQIFSMLYAGERTGRDSSFMRSDAVKALNKYFKTKDISKIIFYMKQDKKNKNSKINLILLKSLSKPILDKSFEQNKIRSFLKSLVY